MNEPPEPHDPDGQVIAAMVETCPSFVGPWERYLSGQASEDRGPYTDAGVFAAHLVDLLERGQTAEFAAVFSAVEHLLGDRDPGVRYLTQVGLLEDLGTIAANRYGWSFA